MKKIISFILMLCMFMHANIIYANNENVSIYLDNEKLTFDQPPFIDNGSTLVPMRTIFEKLGAHVDWDGATQTVTATRETDTIILTIGDTTAYVNGVPLTLEVPAKIVNERTVVPLRFISESLHCKVDWDGNTRSVFITSPEKNNNEATYETTNGYYNEFSGVPALNAPIREIVNAEPASDGYISYIYDYDASDVSTEVLSQYISTLEAHHFYLDVDYANETGSLVFSYINDYAFVYPSGNDQTIRVIVCVSTGDLSDYLDHYSDYPMVPSLDCIAPIYSYLGNYKSDEYSNSYMYSYKDLSLEGAHFYLDILESLGYVQVNAPSNPGVTYHKDNIAVNVSADESSKVLCIEICEVVGIDITTPTPTPSTPDYIPYLGGYTYSPDYTDGYDYGYSAGGTSSRWRLGNVYVSNIRFPLHLYGQDRNNTYLGELTTNTYDRNSFFNPYGSYGSTYSKTSIFNKFSDFGSQYSNYSAFNKYATKPPVIVDSNGNFVAYLTDSPYIFDGATYEELVVFLKANYQ